MKASELREKNTQELQQELLDTLKEQFQLRMQNASGELADNSAIGKSRRKIAQLKTILREKAGETS